MVYLQSRIYLDRDLKIILRAGKGKIERSNSSDNRDKDLERRMRGLAKSQRKVVIDKNESILLKPLNAKERRIVHQFFQDDKQVATTSVGDGHLKQIRLSIRD